MRKGIVGRGIFGLGLEPCRLGAGKGPLGSDEKVDVVKVISFGWVHGHRLLLTLALQLKAVSGAENKNLKNWR